MAFAAGTVVVATTTARPAGAQADQPQDSEINDKPIEERANQLARTGNFPSEAEAGAFEFLNGGFRNTPLGSFRNTPFGGFRNRPLGSFRNAPLSGFRNTPLGPFANGGWPNGGFWGGFHNGGWPNMGWRNWW
jgi:hypothetical protein